MFLIKLLKFKKAIQREESYEEQIKDCTARLKDVIIFNIFFFFFLKESDSLVR